MGGSAVSVKLSGLHGGHSGVDIHKEYGNANKLLARIIMQASGDDDVRLLELSGGSGPTAIPREAYCVVLVPAGMTQHFCDKLSKYFADVRDELKSVEPAIELNIGVCSETSPSVSAEAADAFPLEFCQPTSNSAAVNAAKRMSAWQCSKCEICVVSA